ncbi:MAG: (E)-4-hydroxy-3-methylbut-2-enyl-diphosphate synthase [Opitutaceae bacterium]|nr:(E)-4-hydroxy-3-methylbut-2-enyl-diphosphate synthase [Opitutaceae bacterium]
MSYCASRFRTIRRQTVEVKVGAVGVGAAHPIRLQSMTTSATEDIDATLMQGIALAAAGCEIVRVTAPNVPAARCLKEIRTRLTAAGFGHIPLVADIHFLPQAAMEAIEHVEKVRINPGNYADKKKFAVKEYTDADYDRELQRLHDAFSPLVRRARDLGRALRIGTNHGSLSDRIMNRYGDSPLGMVESALEFVRIAEANNFHGLILSMKASNPKVMIQAYRLLVERLDAAHRPYPLHLGVTEAGDGEDGRIKSAIGIGSLLLDGLGDTIRVSLTEDSVHEIPVARAIAGKAMSLWAAQGPPPEDSLAIGLPSPALDSVDPHHFNRRATGTLTFSTRCVVGPAHPPRVIVATGSVTGLAEAARALAMPSLKDTPVEGLLVPIGSPEDLVALRQVVSELNPSVEFLALELSTRIAPADVASTLAADHIRLLLVRRFAPQEGELLSDFASLVRRHGHFLAVDLPPDSFSALGDTLRAIGDDRLVFTLSNVPPPAHPTGGYRLLAEFLRGIDSRAPIWIRNTAATAVRDEPAFPSKLIEASFLTGGLLGDGIGDLVSVETETDVARAIRLAYNVLQGAGARLSKTEFVACPSCGRTLFDLQATTQRIRGKTGHLKGVKIAIMGCIVNGPGEMADANFGYVGGAPGRINLYVGRKCVRYNIPQAEADDRLISLIKEQGLWLEPGPHSACQP